jgi:hypothetical protein
MKKRRMPKHIVLPNGMWRFVKSGTKSVGKKIKLKRNSKKRGVRIMAKKRRSSRRSGLSSLGGGLMSKGLYSPKGIIASVLIGAGAATLAEKVVPQVIPFQAEAIGFVVGGVGGAAGAFARNALKGIVSGSSNSVNY